MIVLRFLGTTILGGVIVILPLALAAAGIAKAVGVALGILAPIEGWLPEAMHFRTLVAAAAVLATCFAAGLLFRTAVGRAIGRAADRGLLEKIPGYTLFRMITRRLAGKEGQEMAVAAVKMDDHELVGFVMDRLPDGRCAIFVPSSPTPAMGSILVVPGDRVRTLHVPVKQAVSCLSQWGVGASALMAGPAETPKPGP